MPNGEGCGVRPNVCPAVVMGLGITGLGVIRSLGRMGVPTVGLDPAFLEVGRFSKYGKKGICPNPESESDNYIRYLLARGANFQSKAVLYPTTDSDSLVISRYRSKLQQHYVPLVPEFNTVRSIVDKREFHKALLDAGMPSPKTYFADDQQDIIYLGHELVFPCIIKPTISTPFSRYFGKKCFIINNAEELNYYYDLASRNNFEVIIQEIVPGPDSEIYGFCSYANSNSEILGELTYRKVRGYPEGFGLCSVIESTNNPIISRLGKELIKKIGYFGISEIEFKKDPRDNCYKIIEMNARTWGENSIGPRCGVDLSYIAYLDSIGMSPQKTAYNVEGVRWINTFTDSRLLFSRLLKGNDPIELFVEIRGKKEHSVWAIDDIIPSIISPLYLSMLAVEKYANKHTKDHGD